MSSKTRIVVRWPTAIVAIVGIVAVSAVYVLVPDHRGDIGLGVAAAFALLLAVMRRVFGVAPIALALAIAIPVGATGCTAAEGRVALTALELARKIGCDTLCPAEEP